LSRATHVIEDIIETLVRNVRLVMDESEDASVVAQRVGEETGQVREALRQHRARHRASAHSAEIRARDVAEEVQGLGSTVQDVNLGFVEISKSLDDHGYIPTHNLWVSKPQEQGPV
ncbi:MAG: hypothetical protein AAFU79_16740, partial [Myxococcota bacterium]